MSHRLTTWWRALGVVLLSLATVTWPSASYASPTPTFAFVHQGSVVAFGPDGRGSFATSVTPGAVGESARVTIYPRITEESQLAPIVAGTGVSAAPLGESPSVALTCLHQGVDTFGVELFSGVARTMRGSCQRVMPSINLHCVAQTCSGVYPLRYQFVTPTSLRTIWSLVTVKAGAPGTPLNVAYVGALTAASASEPVASTATLRALAAFSNTPVAIAAGYPVLQDLARLAATSPLRRAYDGAVRATAHAALNAPPANVDFGGLVNNGFTAQVASQLGLTTSLVHQLTGRSTDGPLWLGGSPSLSSLNALAGAGIRDVVIPEGQLSVAPSSTLSWGQPFHVDGAATLNAFATNGPLTALLDGPTTAGLRAALVTGALDFLYFEAPNATSPRAVILDAPIAATSAALVSNLFTTLNTDPYVHLTSLANAFAVAPLGGNGAPTSRTLTNVINPSTWSPHNDQSLSALLTTTSSYAQAIANPALARALAISTAQVEIVGSPAQRQVAIDAVANNLQQQLNQFSIDPSSITLAGNGTSLPITLFSRAPYTITAVVHLVTNRLGFPKGNAVAMTLDAPTKSIRVATTTRGGTSLTLQVYVTTPNGAVIIAHSAIQVRIAGTSAVGYLLSLASLLVLAMWWLRTHRRRRGRGRHAQ